MKQRIITGLIFGIVSLFMILFNDLTRIVFLVIAGLMSALEYFDITRNSSLKKWSGMLAILICFASFFIFKPPANIISIVLCVIFTVYLFSLKNKNVFDLHSRFAPLISILYLGLSFGLHIELVQTYKINFLLITIILIWVADSGAYFVGRTIGKRKFAPSISPKKTWEGFLGGGMLTVLVSYIIASIYETPFGLQFWILFGIAVWFFGALGDLVESHIKRSFEVKDSGTLLPGHGGFLDRFDGFIYVLPYTALIIYYQNLLS